MMAANLAGLRTHKAYVLGIELDGQRDVPGHWVGDGAEGANFWLNVVTELQARGLLFLVTRDITRKWTMPPQNWACILNQLAIRFEGRFPLN